MLAYLDTDVFLMCYSPTCMPVKVASYKIPQRIFALNVCSASFCVLGVSENAQTN